MPRRSAANRQGISHYLESGHPDSRHGYACCALHCRLSYNVFAVSLHVMFVMVWTRLRHIRSLATPSWLSSVSETAFRSLRIHHSASPADRGMLYRSFVNLWNNSVVDSKLVSKYVVYNSFVLSTDPPFYCALLWAVLTMLCYWIYTLYRLSQARWLDWDFILLSIWLYATWMVSTR